LEHWKYLVDDERWSDQQLWKLSVSFWSYIQQECGLRLIFAHYVTPFQSHFTRLHDSHSQCKEDIGRTDLHSRPRAPEMALTWPRSPLFKVDFHCCDHRRPGRNTSRTTSLSRILQHIQRHDSATISFVLQAKQSCLSNPGL